MPQKKGPTPAEQAAMRAKVEAQKAAELAEAAAKKEAAAAAAAAEIKETSSQKKRRENAVALEAAEKAAADSLAAAKRAELGAAASAKAAAESAAAAAAARAAAQKRFAVKAESKKAVHRLEKLKQNERRGPLMTINRANQNNFRLPRSRKTRRRRN